MYGCETWSLILREDCRLREFENRVLWRIFGPKRDEVTREWRKLLTGLYFSPNNVQVINLRKMRWAGHVAHTGEISDVYSVLVGKPDRKKPHVRPRVRWQGNIKMHLQEAGCVC